MKRVFAFLIIICMLPLLSGCGSIYTNYREVEQILVVQTMGLDHTPGGVRLTLAAPSAARREDSPVYLSGTGESITTAIERVRNYSSEEDIFCAHINHMVFGEEAAQRGIDNYLAYLCRSPEMRIDTPLYVVKGCQAYDIISGVIGSGTGICEVLQAVRSNADDRGDSYVFTAAQVLRSLNRYGSALLCALEFSQSDEVSGDGGGSKGGDQSSSASQGGSGQDTGGSGESMTAAVSGYAVIKDGKLCGYIDRDKAVGASLLMNLMAVTHIVVRDTAGKPVTLELSQGSSKLTPVWGEDGNLQGINISADVTASILEMEANENVSEAEFEDYITARLENAVSDRISSVLQLSKKLEADFLGLAGQVELADPVKYRNMEQSFLELLPKLELRISVSGALSHTNNLKDT